jgi:hypothetical protein
MSVDPVEGNKRVVLEDSRLDAADEEAGAEEEGEREVLDASGVDAG